MAGKGLAAWLLLGWLPGEIPLLAQLEPQKAVRAVQAPPPAVPVLERGKMIIEPVLDWVATAQTPVQYGIGEPTDAEQHMIELVNRARGNPAAEGRLLAATTDPDVLAAYQFFQLDRDLMITQYDALPPVPPVAPHAALLSSARAHSLDMWTHAFQGHVGTDGSSIGDRITRAGLVWSLAGENVYAWAESVWHGHAGFEADWGSGPGGMQTPPGHRLTTHRADLRCVGVGLTWGTNTVGANTVGPLVVVQDYAEQSSPAPYITGVAYYDLDGDASYEAGEGVGGVRVTVAGNGFFALTALAGGYAVPVPGDGTYTVTFSGSGLTEVVRQVTVTNRNNVKLDLSLPYQAPAITGPASITVGQGGSYQFSSVPLASGYQLARVKRLATNFVDGAEAGLTNFSASISSGYAAVATDVRAVGQNSFHLAHSQPVAQWLVLPRSYLVGATAHLQFRSRLGWATSSQVAHAQVSFNQGEWQDLWTQAGTGAAGDTDFTARSFTLGDHAGAEMRLRFGYDFSGGSYFPQTSSGVGLYLDEINLTGVEELVSPETIDLGLTSVFLFNPAGAGDYALRMRPQVSQRNLGWGPMFMVRAVAVPPTVRLRQLHWAAGGRVQIDFEASSGDPTSFFLQTATVLPSNPALPGAWATDMGATITSVATGQFQAVTSTGGAARRYFRIGAR